MLCLRRITALLPLLTVYVATVPAAFCADDPLEQYFTQLRSRRLFAVAEGYALERLSRDDLSLQQRTVFALELSRTLSNHAEFVAGDEQTDLWNRADQTLDQLIADIEALPDPPNELVRSALRVRVAAQRALNTAVRGEYLRWQIELRPHDAPLRQNATRLLNNAVGQLTSADEQIAELVRASPAAVADRYQLPAWELRDLQYHLRYQLGISHLTLAHLAQVDTAERSTQIDEAAKWLKPLSESASNGDVQWNSRLGLCVCLRLSGEYDRAQGVLLSLLKKQPPPEVRHRIVGEQVRNDLATGQAPDAADLLVNYSQQHPLLPGELRYLQVQSLLALWNIAAQKQQEELAQLLMEQIGAHVERCEQEVGGYWAARCRMSLNLMQDSAKFGSELAAAIREAKAAYASGQVSVAIDAYGKAAAAAFRNGQTQPAFDLGYTRASIELQAGHFAASAADFNSLVDAFPNNPRAPRAHLLKAYALGKAYDARRTQSRREEYTNALLSHRERFANDPTNGDATWMLARLEEQRLQVTRALALYDEIPSSHTHGADAHVAVARCYEKILARLRELQQPVDEWESAAIVRLTEFQAEAPSSQALTGQQAEVALRLARILLNRSSPYFAEADALLMRVLVHHGNQTIPANANSHSTQPRQLWLGRTAKQLRVVSLAGQNRLREAESLIDGLSQNQAAEALSVLDGLTQLADNVSLRTKRELGELQLRAANTIATRRNELTPAERTRLDSALAQAYLATNQPGQALQVYESLLQQSPKDRALLLKIGDILLECGTQDCYQKAHGIWQKIEASEKPGSIAWLQARYQVARCSFELKQFRECRKLVGVTRLLYPELGNEELRADFAELEAQVAARRK